MACANICGKDAIKMKRDKSGFAYPFVDPQKCVHCGLCRKVCPMEESCVGKPGSPDIYALQNHSAQVLSASSSGGMFTLLARWVLSQEGVIYGVAFDDAFSVRHMRAVTQEEAMAFRTSKYVESDLSSVYRTILEDVRSGKTVLFTGTPCQVSAIKKYLELRRADCSRVYTCDNVCHGVPSRKLWADYLKILRENYMEPDDQITYINMRSKRFSWKKQVMDIGVKKGNLDKVLKDFSFNRLFLSLYGNRPSCFHCRYTSFLRPGDFSLGDFWNVENAGITFDVEGGVNLVLVNTPKGRELFQQLRSDAHWQSVSQKAAWQPHLEYSAKPPANQAQFWKEYLSAPEDGREKVMRKYMQGSLITRIIRLASPFLRKTGLYGFAGKLYKLLIVRKK